MLLVLLHIHSYRNPVEQIISIVNTRIQAIALARHEMPEEMEAEAARCNKMKALRTVSERSENFRGACLDIVFAAASEQEMEEYWSVLIALDSDFPLNYCDKVSANNLSHTLSEFIAVWKDGLLIV